MKQLLGQLFFDPLSHQRFEQRRDPFQPAGECTSSYGQTTVPIICAQIMGGPGKEEFAEQDLGPD